MIQSMIPCIIHEDEDILVVNKPSGIPTHRPAAEGPWGLTDYLEHRRPDLGGLGIHQRLDRETSGLMIFSRSARARSSLGEQFEKHLVRKTYHLATRGNIPPASFTANREIDGKASLTHFQHLRKLTEKIHLWEASPETGRTHQVRIHAAHHDIPIIGDTDGKNLHEPLMLHASRLTFRHPADGSLKILEAPLPPWFSHTQPVSHLLERALHLRSLLLDPAQNTFFRLIHRSADGFSDFTLDQMDSWLYLEDFRNPLATPPLPSPEDESRLMKTYRGLIRCKVRQGERREQKSPEGKEAPPDEVVVLENGIRYLLRPMEPGGMGLFGDQRENRLILTRLAKDKRVLNLFAYTCGFSVAAAAGGARETISVDLSRKYLEWGRRNFEINRLPVENHRFLARDARDTLRKFQSSKETFDLIILDPPSFSRSKTSGTFNVEKDLPKLVSLSMPLLAPGGQILASSNLSGWKPRDFEESILKAVKNSGRRMGKVTPSPQPFDFPFGTGHPAYLKTIWVEVN